MKWRDRKVGKNQIKGETGSLNEKRGQNLKIF